TSSASGFRQPIRAIHGGVSQPVGDREARCGRVVARQGNMTRMSEVTRILDQLEQGDALAAEQLLPLVYDELRKLATQKLAHEQPGQTLQATALVHEAYLRLVAEPGRGDRGEPGLREPRWESRGHFFAAAAEAMRRILIEMARRKGRVKRGGG